MKRTILIAALLLAACGQGGGSPDIAVSDAWARETHGGSTAAYLTIANSGASGDRLLSVSVAAPAHASLHSTTTENGIARMRPLADGLELPAGKTVVLRPGGDHVMVMGLQGPLEAGGALPLTLRFEHSGERQVAAEVRPAGAAAMNH